MTVEQLISILIDYPPELEIFTSDLSYSEMQLFEVDKADVAKVGNSIYGSRPVRELGCYHEREYKDIRYAVVLQRD